MEVNVISNGHTVGCGTDCCGAPVAPAPPQAPVTPPTAPVAPCECHSGTLIANGFFDYTDCSGVRFSSGGGIGIRITFPSTLSDLWTR